MFETADVHVCLYLFKESIYVTLKWLMLHVLKKGASKLVLDLPTPEGWKAELT